MNKLILGFGESLVDLLPSGEVVGGAPLNFSVRAAQLCRILGRAAGPMFDARTALISRIGSDLRGEKILQHLQSTPLDTSAIQIDGIHPSGFVDVTFVDGQPSYVIGQQVAWDHITFNAQAAELARKSSAICFGSLSQRASQTRQTLAQCLQVAEQAIKIFDINLRQPHPPAALIDESLCRADVLKCNEEELLLLNDYLQLDMLGHQASTHGASIAGASIAGARSAAADSIELAAAIAGQLQSRYDLKFVFWTRGASGCILQRGNKRTMGTVPQLPQAPQADSVGAGDAASAALTVGLIAGWNDDQVVSLANYCGAFAASQRGATTPFPENFLDHLSG